MAGPQSTINLKALGLNTQPNELAVDPGSLDSANNIVIKRDNVVESRRGYTLYGESFGTSTDTASQLFEYKQAILRHYNDILAYDTGTQDINGQEIFNDFCGVYNEVVQGLRIKGIEANGNFYFTTSEGIQKISALTRADFTQACGFITPAGGLKALDITALLDVEVGVSTGFLPVDSVVAYRVVWGTTDANGNLILGTPSARAVVYNSLQQMIVRDMMQVLQALDNLDVPAQSNYTDGNYVQSLGLPLSANADNIQENLIALTTKLDQEEGTLISQGSISTASIGSLGLMTITLNTGSVGTLGLMNVGDSVYLDGNWIDSGGVNFGGASYSIASIAFVSSTAEVSTITVPDGSIFAASHSVSNIANYFLISGGNNTSAYYVWFDVDGGVTDPMVPGYTGIEVDISATDIAVNVASALATALSSITAQFAAANNSNIVTVTNVIKGPANDISPLFNTGPMGGIIGYSAAVTVQGSGNGDIITLQTTDTNVGPVTLSSASVQSGFFRAIAQPALPDNPATNAELVALQNYLGNIILELQSPHNVILAADTTSISSFPLTISSASINSINNLQINFGAGQNAKNVFEPGDKIFLSGTWTDSAAGSLSNYYSVSSVSLTQINVVVTDTNLGPVTVDSSSEIQIIRRFSDALQVEFVNGIALTQSANVELIIPIPAGANSNYFFQVYRSNITQASGTDVLQDLIPDDEMRQVYEAFPTAAQFAAGEVIVIDIVPQSFFQGGAFLYTDETNGDGILQANEPPPLAQDINLFQGTVFYANTKSKHNLNITLLGVSKIIQDYLNGNEPTLTIASSLGVNDYRFINGVNEITNITVPAASVFSTSATPSYFLLNGGNDTRQYYVWFHVEGSSNVDPAPTGLIGIEVTIQSTDTNVEVAQKLTNALSVIVDDFSAMVSSNTVTVTNIQQGPATDISPVSATGTMSGVTGYSASVSTQGNGQNIQNQTTQIVTAGGSSFTASGNGDYFTINSAFDRNINYFWFNVNNGNINPSLPGLTGIEIDITPADSSTTIAGKIANSVNSLTGVYSASVIGSTVTIVNNSPGPAQNATKNSPALTISTTLEGALNVLLSNSVSPSLAVQETAQSLVNVINLNNAEIVYGFYSSGVTDVPGKILLQARTIQDIPFYVVTNTNATGSSFTPDLSPDFTITNISTGNPSTITAGGTTGLTNTSQVILSNTNSFPIVDGIFSVSQISTSSFQISMNVITTGNQGAGIVLSDAQVSSNDVAPNRVFYSKYLQPEAVPLVNFIDIGAKDKAILRIMPLRQSLFVLKEDGVFRISGESEPFTTDLFDTSYIVIAADSVAIANNVIYSWTTQGIMSLTEGGSQIISRPIDVDILPLSSQQYTNFNTATWGVGYNSEYSYLIWTVTQPSDIVATQAYIYNSLTATWVRWDKSNTCGINNPVDNKLYLGAGDVNFLEQERKNFDRTDYADREIDISIEAGNYIIDQNNLKLFQLTSVNQFSPGDVITQEQTVTIYNFDNLTLKIDADPTINTRYVPSAVTFDFPLQTISVTFSGSVPINYQVGTSVILSNVNPVSLNGTYVISMVGPTSIQLTAPLSVGTVTAINPGLINISENATIQPQPGTSMRDAIESLGEMLSINPSLAGLEYVNDIGDYTYSGLSVSATNPAIFTMPAFTFSSSSVDNITGEMIVNNILQVGDMVDFSSTGTLPGGLFANSIYYVHTVSSSSFFVSLTPSGSILTFSDSGSGQITAQQLHGLQTNRYIQVSASTTTPNINSNYAVTRINAYQFSIPVDVNTQGTANIETLINSFQDIQATYNIIVNDLNLDTGTSFKNYTMVSGTTLLETPILDINYPLKQLTIQDALAFIIGPITVYKGIDSEFEYTPLTMNDSMSLKHFREATIMYINKTFTNATLTFASDLLPEIEDVPVFGMGAGLFGNDPNGENYYGGNSNSIPFRTTIPLDKARCRFLRMGHKHTVAREKYSILGTSLTGRIVSTRGYR